MVLLSFVFGQMAEDNVEWKVVTNHSFATTMKRRKDTYCQYIPLSARGLCLSCEPSRIASDVCGASPGNGGVGWTRV